MSTELVLLGFFSGILGLSLTWVIYSRQDEETVAYPENTNKQRYYPFIPGSLLPFCFLCYIVWFWRMCTCGILFQRHWRKTRSSIFKRNFLL